MDLLNKLTIKNLKLNKKRTIVTIIGIMLSVALITAVASMYASGLQSLINFETREKGNFHVVYYNVPISEINTFKNNRKIEAINLTQNIGYAKIDSQNEYKPYAYIKAFTDKSLENLSIKLVEGKLPQNENEIVIPTHLKTNGRVFFNVGDTITLNVGKRVESTGYELDQSNPFRPNEGTEHTYNAETGELISETDYEKSNEKIVDTQKKEYKIVGIIERPASNIESYSAPGYTFITYIDENKLSGNVDVYARYTKDGVKDSYKTTANILGVNQELYEKVNADGNKPTDEELKQYQVEMEKSKYQIDVNSYLIGLETDPLGVSSTGGLAAVVGIVIGIIVFTSVFCIKNSFDISITEKTKQYGMLRSIGATKKQIKRNVFYEATILGIIGIPLGILLGFLASFILCIISNYFFAAGSISEGLRLEFAFSWLAVLVAIMLGIITIYFSAFRSARRASKVSPIDSIRNSSDIKIKSKKIKSSKIIKKIFGIGGEISYKNLKRNKKKYRTTVISIVVSVFVFIALSSFMSMAFDVVENELNVVDYNISLSSTTQFDEKDEKLNKFIDTTKLDNIENYTVLRQLGIDVSNINYNKEYVEFLKWDEEIIKNNKDSYISLMAIGKEQYSKFLDSLELKYEDMKDKGILVDYSNLEMYDEQNNHIKKYMRILDYNTGDIINGTIAEKNDEQLELKIGYVSEVEPFGLKNVGGYKIIISDELYEKLNIQTRSIQIYYKSTNPDKLQDEIDELLKGEDYNLNNIAESVKMMNNLFTLIGIFLYGFIIVISLIGITNIFNTITTNMELRKQEFAMLKSVGMTNKEFRRMIRLESTFMGVKSLLYGVPIGIGLSYLIYHFLQESSGLPYKLPVVSILITVIAVFLLITSLMKYSMNKINKQNTIETIRNENI